jgi:hypothetical protein
MKLLFQNNEQIFCPVLWILIHMCQWIRNTGRPKADYYWGGAAQIVVRRVGLLYGRPGFDSRLGTPVEIPLLSSSSEDIGVGLNDCD